MNTAPTNLARRRLTLALAAAGLGGTGAARAAAGAALQWPPELTPLRGLAGADLACDALEIEGDWPRDLRGVLYRNGPALYERDGQRYRHWFDGDGMVQAFRCDGRRVSHRGRFVRTPKFNAEQAAGRFLYPAFGTPIAGAAPVRNADQVNTANTNVSQHGGRLLALWEAGSATALDAATLDTRGTVAWRDDLAGTPFTAHPKVDSRGTLWAFGALTGSEQLALYEIDAAGRLRRFALLPVPPVSMLHDFVVTERYLVFVLPSARFERERARAAGYLLGGFVEAPGQPQRVLVVAKSDLATVREYELPPGFVFHFGNGWDDADGSIRFDLVLHNGAAVMTEAMPALMRGEASAEAAGTPRIAQVALAPRAGRVQLALLPEPAEFPRIDPRRVGLRHRQLIAPVAIDSRHRFGFNAVQRLDIDSGRIDRYVWGDGYVIEEQLLVPRSAGAREGEGWIVGTGFDVRRQVSFVGVFDAQRVAAGPLAIARLPYALPSGFHGNFVAG
jgi:all-trans-8'-apo-beta-carotenal 15,15'-oxygenase